MSVVAAIKINGTLGSVASLPLSTTVTLTNANNAGVSSWLYTLVTPPGSTATLTGSSGSDGWSFTPDKVGPYSIGLQLNANPTLADLQIAEVDTLLLGLHLPGFKEQLNFDAVRGWMGELTTDLLTLESAVMLSTVKTVQFGASVVIGPGYISNYTTLGDGSVVPVVKQASASALSTLSGLCWITAAASSGVVGSVITWGISGATANTAGQSVGALVYVTNAGGIAFTPGTFVAQIGTVLTVGASGRIFVSPSATGLSAGVLSGLVTTTNATPTTIATIAMTDSTTVAINVNVAAYSAGATQGGGATGSAAFRCDASGVVHLIGAPQTTAFNEGSSAWNLSFAISGSSVLLQVTGQASTTIDWSVSGSTATAS